MGRRLVWAENDRRKEPTSKRPGDLSGWEWPCGGGKCDFAEHTQRWPADRDRVESSGLGGALCGIGRHPKVSVRHTIPSFRLGTTNSSTAIFRPNFFNNKFPKPFQGASMVKADPRLGILRCYLTSQVQTMDNHRDRLFVCIHLGPKLNATGLQNSLCIIKPL